TDSWFSSKNQESIDALGGRYTPELNFKLPFLRFLNGFNRDRNFIDSINSYYEAVLEKHRRTHLRVSSKELEEKTSVLNNAIDVFKTTYECLTFSGVDTIPFEAIRSDLI